MTTIAHMIFVHFHMSNYPTIYETHLWGGRSLRAPFPASRPRGRSRTQPAAPSLALTWLWTSRRRATALRGPCARNSCVWQWEAGGIPARVRPPTAAPPGRAHAPRPMQRPRHLSTLQVHRVRLRALYSRGGLAAHSRDGLLHRSSAPTQGRRTASPPGVAARLRGPTASTSCCRGEGLSQEAACPQGQTR